MITILVPSSKPCSLLLERITSPPQSSTLLLSKIASVFAFKISFRHKRNSRAVVVAPDIRGCKNFPKCLSRESVKFWKLANHLCIEQFNIWAWLSAILYFNLQLCLFLLFCLFQDTRSFLKWPWTTSCYYSFTWMSWIEKRIEREWNWQWTKIVHL